MRDLRERCQPAAVLLLIGKSALDLRLAKRRFTRPGTLAPYPWPGYGFAMASNDGPNTAALFEAANKLRGSVESAEYNHLVLGLIFLKYISDSFEFRRQELEAELSDPQSEGYLANDAERPEVVEDRDEYVGKNVFWVPEPARWSALLAAASQPDIGNRLDDALEAIEHENPRLRNVLPRIYARAPLSAESWRRSPRSASARAPKRRVTSSGAHTSTSSRSSPAPRGTAAASSSRRHPWRGCWSRCSSLTRAGCSTRPAGRAACSCSRPSSSRRTAGGPFGSQLHADDYVENGLP